ncbi:hypothetical protein BDN70DRAFT_987936 [Pholiota conissans]|uniref:Uncharacterized protein n=1 Tax=Pholiota conissans TaxID=109636 RepID=A0A9P5ZH73_9AGAR|nr:hypothetical protein BDN70DRAFT_987936 [Pholiota conissans]
MATFEAESLRSPALSSTESVSESLETAKTRKRPRETFEDSFDDGQWDLTDDGRPKTRRVNPQRLAIRLGPDLVAEMEALIIPGAKMPTFTVRKDFQERYNVDRRHIYDYFHSRGLRVAKEDKHTNLIRGRAMKAQAQAQAQLQAISQPPDPVVKQECAPCDVPIVRPFLVQIQQSPVKPRGRIVKRTSKVTDKKPRTAGTKRRATTARASETLNIFRDSELPVTPLSGDGSESFAATSSGTDTDWESASACPQFAMPDGSEYSNGSIKKETRGIPDFLPSPDDFVVGYFESSSSGNAPPPFLDLESSLLPCGLDDFGTLMTMNEHRLLTEEERNELYDLIDNNIPRVGGADDSTGTYTTFMSGESRSYFDLPVTSHTDNGSKRAGNHSAVVADSPIALDIPDLRKWLSDDLDLCHSGMNLHALNPIRNSFEGCFE